MLWTFIASLCASTIIPSLQSHGQARALPDDSSASSFIPSDIDLWNFYRIVPSTQRDSSLSTAPASVFTVPQITSLEGLSNSATQFWYFEAIPEGQQTQASANDSNRYYRLRNVVTGPCCSLGVADKEAGTVGVGKGIGGPASEWAVTRVDGKPGQWHIVSNGIAWDPNTPRRKLGITATGEVYLAEADEVDSETLSWQVLALVRRIDSPRC
jgi:hypothetical protein